MSVPIICKFDEDVENIFLIVCLMETKWQETLISLIMRSDQKSNSFMAVLITCKSDEDSIKKEITIIQTTFS